MLLARRLLITFPSFWLFMLMCALRRVSIAAISVRALFLMLGLAYQANSHALSMPAETYPNTARFEVIAAPTPPIARGAAGTQTITIQNKGPNGATGTQAFIRPQLTTGVTIGSVTGPSGVCTFSSPDYVCTVGTVANNGTFTVDVVYNVALSASTGTTIKQTEVRVNSSEFNPGSGVGETSHKVWGALNQENPTTQYGSFWTGRTSTNPNCNGGSTTCGTFAGEDTALTSAWPANQDLPTGEYVNSAVAGDNNDVHFVAGTKNPTYYRVVNDMAAYALRRLVLPSVTGTNTINNRRAWEFRTYVYVPAATSADLCQGETGFFFDDGVYISGECAITKHRW